MFNQSKSCHKKSAFFFFWDVAECISNSLQQHCSHVKMFVILVRFSTCEALTMTKLNLNDGNILIFFVCKFKLTLLHDK